MTKSAQIFDTKLAQFKEYQETPWGRIGYKVTFVNIQRYLDETPLHVLDAGGGNGLDSVLFAALGHTVTLVDVSSEMLSDAKRHAETHGVAEKITYIKAALDHIPTLFPEPGFDIILCHNVLPYVDDIESALTSTCHALKPNGFISIKGVNRYSISYRDTLQQNDLNAAYSNLNKNTYISPVLKTPIRAYAVEDVMPILENIGLIFIEQFGIRCVCDYIANNELKYDPRKFEQLEQLECAMSDKYPYKLLARFFQIIARKKARQVPQSESKARKMKNNN
jgi:S-adenosylmethionine-dependent methyltransferase